MADVFEPTSINRMEIANRFVRSATYEGLADEKGFVTDALIELYDNLAGGGIGLIVVGYAYVQPNGKGAPGMLGIWSDDYIEGFERLARAAHSHGAKIAAQIVHCGRQTFEALIDGTPVGPSPVPTIKFGNTPRELTAREIRGVIDDFASAAARAKGAGFDAVQIHCAHGYLLNQFLAKGVNIRTDEYGGDMAGRAKALFDTYAAIREAVGNDYPVLIKLNCADFMPGGLEVEESVWVASRLAKMGIDAVEISGGTWDTELPEGKSIQKGVPRRSPEGYFLPYVEKFTQAVDAPIIAVGGVRTIELSRKIIAEGTADFVSMCRPFICEPHLLKRWRTGDTTPSRCVSCNQCLARCAEEGLQCFKKERSRTTNES